MKAPRGKSALLLVLGLIALGTALFWPRLVFDTATVHESPPDTISANPAHPGATPTPQPDLPPPAAAPERAASDIPASRPAPAPPPQSALAALPAEPAPKDPAKPNNDFFDPVYGVTGKIPEGWTMRNSARWGTLETTLFFRDPDAPMSAPSFYYRVFSEPMKHNSPAEIEAWMRETAEGKARQRVTGGLADYTNGEVVMHNINDRPALTWTATYTRNGEPWGEFLTRLYSPNGTYLFFLHAPAAELPAVRAKFETMIKTTVVP